MLEFRPAALIFLALTAGIAAGLFFNFWITALQLSFIWGAVMLKRPVRRRRFVAVTALIVVLIGYIYGTVYSYFSQAPTPKDGTSYSLRGVVKDIGTTKNGLRYTVDFLEGSGSFTDYSAYVYDVVDYNNGDVIDICGSITVAAASSKGNGVDYTVYGSTSLRKGEKAEGFSYKLLYLRSWLSKLILKTFKGDAGEFYNAVITGDRSGIDNQINGSFSRSGLSHIIAISGQHFSILVFSIYSMLMILFGKKKLISTLCILLAVSYTLLVGASPSVVRACIMCCMVFAANMSSRNHDACTALCFAFAILAVFSPYSVASISLLLSFLSTLGILMLTEIEYTPPGRSLLRKVIAFFITPVKVSLAATLFCLPVLVTAFDYVSIVSPFSNLAANVLIGPSMALSVITVPIANLIPSIGAISKAPEFIYVCIKSISDFMASLPFASVSSSVPHIKLIIIPAAVMIFGGLFLRRSKAIKVIAISIASIIIVLLACVYSYKAKLNDNSIFYLSDAENSSFVFYTDGDESILFSVSGTSDCSDVILERGYTHIDSFVILNCNEDAITRLENTLCYISIDSVYAPKSYYKDYYYKKITDLKCNIKQYDGKLSLSDTKLLSKHGDYLLSVKNNDTSLLLLSGYKAGSEEKVDGLIVAGNTWATEIHQSQLPKSFDTLFINDVTNTYFTAELKEKAEKVSTYYSTIELRLGENGLQEIKT